MTRPSAARRAVRRAALVVGLGVVALLAPACSDDLTGGPTITATFQRGTGLYPGSPVRVIGIDVGRVTEVRNAGGVVEVEMELAEGTELPADVSATIIPLTLLGERYVQLGPAYQEGPMLGDGDEIPIERTTIPAEIDELLRSLQDFMGAIDPERASDVVTNLAELVDGRGEELNQLLGSASGALDLLADEGEDIEAIIGSLGELSAALEGRTDSIETLIRNYELVTEVLLANRGDLEAAIVQLDRAAVELAALLETHEDPLREDVVRLANTTGTVAANTDNLTVTLDSTVKLFEAAGRAYDARTNSLRVNNQNDAGLTTDLIAGRLRDRIAGICRRLGIQLCSDPASPLLNDVAALLPGLLSNGGEPPAPPAPPESPDPVLPDPTVPTPTVPPLPAIPSQDELLDALVRQLEEALDERQLELLRSIDGERLAALLGVDPRLLQALGELDEEQVERLREADPDDIPKLMLDLYNEVFPPDQRLDVPLLPPRPGGTPTTLLPPLPGGGGSLPDLPLGG